MAFTYSTVPATLRRSDADPIVSAANNDVEGIGFFSTTAERDDLSDRLRQSNFVAIVGSTIYLYTGPNFTPTSNDDFIADGPWQNTSNWSEVSGGTATLDLDELTDVDAASPSDGQILMFDSNTNKWYAATLSIAISDVSGLQTALDGKSSTSHNHTLTSLADVTGSGLQSGDGLRWNGTTWTPFDSDAAYATAIHGHGISEITGLQTALNAKADLGHNHDSDYADINHAHEIDDFLGSAASTADLIQKQTDGSWAPIAASNFATAAALTSTNSLAVAAASSAAANTADIADLRTLTGTSDGDTDLGAFTGSVLTDNTDLRSNLQELSDAVELAAGGGASELDDLTDVDTTGKASGDLLKYDGTDWIPFTPDYAEAGHDHNGDYAPLSHDHDADYAALGHNHDGVYSPVSHNHDGTYAPLTHNHDGDYAAIGHNHDSDYAALGHDHDSDYAPIVHNHDTDYAAINHDHDADYAALGHTHEIDDFLSTAGSTGDLIQKQVNGTWAPTPASGFATATSLTSVSNTANGAIVAAAANSSDIADLRTMTGTADGDTDMGTFTGSVLTDSTDLRSNLQELSDAVELAAGGGASELDDLTDVDTTGKASGDLLQYDGADWIPFTPNYAGATHNHDADYAPISHNHDADYAPISHTHTIAQVTGLQTALDGKADTAHNHDSDYADIAHNHDADYAAIGHDHDATYAALGHDHDSDYAAINHDHDADYAALSHTHSIAQVTGLQTALDGKAATGHDHDSDYAAIGHDHDSDYAAIAHNHDSDYAAIGHDHDSDYAALSHTHGISDVTGLQTALNAKANVGHNHNGTYALIGHTHDGVYAPVSHTHNKAEILDFDETDYTPSTTVATTETTPAGWGSTEADVNANLNAAKIVYWDGTTHKHTSMQAWFQAMLQVAADGLGASNPDLYDTQLGSAINPLDINGDGVIGSADLIQFLTVFGANSWNFVNSVWNLGFLNTTSGYDVLYASNRNPYLSLDSASGYTPGAEETFDLDVHNVGLSDPLSSVITTVGTHSAIREAVAPHSWVGFENNSAAESSLQFPMNPNLKVEFQVTHSGVLQLLAPDTITYTRRVKGYDSTGALLFEEERQTVGSFAVVGDVLPFDVPNVELVEVPMDPDLDQIRASFHVSSENGNVEKFVMCDIVKIRAT